MPGEAAASQGMAPVHGYRPGEKKTQMLPQGRREYALQRSLMKVTGSDLMKLLRMVTTLSIVCIDDSAGMSQRNSSRVMSDEESACRSLVVDCNRSGEIGYRIPAWGECERQARVPVPDGTVGA